MKPEDLKSWRQSMRLSQKEAAEALGMTRQGYQLLEYGKYPIDRRTELACERLAELSRKASHAQRPDNQQVG